MFFINMSIPLSLWTRVFCGYFNNESKSKTKEIKVNYPIDLTDQLGRQVKVDNKPERIVKAVKNRAFEGTLFRGKRNV